MEKVVLPVLKDGTVFVGTSLFKRENFPKMLVDSQEDSVVVSLEYPPQTGYSLFALKVDFDSVKNAIVESTLNSNYLIVDCFNTDLYLYVNTDHFKYMFHKDMYILYNIKSGEVVPVIADTEKQEFIGKDETWEKVIPFKQVSIFGEYVVLGRCI